MTGLTSAQLDFRDQVGSQLPVIIGVVIAAAHGVIVAVFQWGWGSSLLGVSEKVPVESYVPMMMFAIVFGLSMDYEVFLLSRIREAWLASRDNHASVAAGLAATARVISCAALIMASMFLIGRLNWWMPGWLDRIMPRLEAEGHSPRRPSGEPPGVVVR